MEQQMLDQADAIFDAIFKPRERRTIELRRIIESPEFEEDRRAHLDRRMHRIECMAGYCCCGEE